MEMRIESLCWNVKDLDKAVALFSDLFDTEFINPTEIIEKNHIKVDKIIVKENIGLDPYRNAAEARMAVSPIGLELLQTIPPLEKEGIRSIAFRVSDIETAKEKLQSKGIHMLWYETIGGFKGAVFAAADLHGIRLTLCEYEGVPDGYYWEAFHQKPKK